MIRRAWRKRAFLLQAVVGILLLVPCGTSAGGERLTYEDVVGEALGYSYYPSEGEEGGSLHQRGELPSIPPEPLGAQTKVCVTGHQMLAKRATNEYYKDEKELIFDLAGILNKDLRGLVAAGCTFIQIDEPVWVGYPQDMPWLVQTFNKLVEGVDAKIALHACYGNYQLKKLFSGQYAELFPAILDANCHQICLEFAVSDGVGLELFKQYPTNKEVGVGVIDVKDQNVETPDVVANRIRQALKFIPAERMTIVPDCGMKFMPRDRAFGKLKAMVEGTKMVRKELGVR